MLDDVLGVVRPAEHVAAEREQPEVVALVERLERRRVAAPGGARELRVGRRAALRARWARKVEDGGGHRQVGLPDARARQSSDQPRRPARVS